MKKYLKYILGGLGACCVLFAVFAFPFGQETITVIPTTYAADTGPSQTKLGELATALDSILSFLYLVMRPLMYVAGLAMDNNLIYAEGLGIGGMLYGFWSLMRTIANFVIVGVIVWIIGQRMLKKDKGESPMKIFITLAITTIAINSSWWLIGALVDLSTIATYGVGAIPMKLQQGDANEFCITEGDDTKHKGNISKTDDIHRLGNCKPVLSTHGTMNLSNTLSASTVKWKIYYSYDPKDKPTQYYLTCPFESNVLTKSGRDALYNGFVKSIAYDTQGKPIGVANIKDKSQIQDKYCVVGQNQLLKLESLPIESHTTGYYNALIAGMDTVHKMDGLRVRNLVDANRGMIGVLYTMYGSILGFSTIKSDVGSANTESQIIQFVIKGFFGFAILFPLIALTIVLVIRVVKLRMVIAFAPLLMIGRVFGLRKSNNELISSMMETIGKNLTLGNVVNLLFQPVLVVFTMSVGLMFLDALSTALAVNGGFSDALSCKMTNGQQCCSMIEVVNICFESFNHIAATDAFFNYFTYAITNVIGVMMLWFMMFAVMKSNDITKAVVGKIENMGTSILGSMPVVPWFGGDFVGVTGAKEGLQHGRKQATEEYKDDSGDKIAKPTFDRLIENMSGKVGEARRSIASGAVASGTPDAVDTKNISNITSSNDTGERAKFAKNLLKAVEKPKDSAKHSDLNELIDTSDKNIKTLLDAYNVKNGLELLSNPRFLADTSKTSKDIVGAYAASNKTRQGHELGKAKYMAKLKEQTDALIKETSKKIDIGTTQTIVRTTSGANPGLYTITKSALPGQTALDQYAVSFTGLKAQLTRQEAEAALNNISSLTSEQAKNLGFQESFTETTSTKDDKGNTKDTTTKRILEKPEGGTLQYTEKKNT